MFPHRFHEISDERQGAGLEARAKQERGDDVDDHNPVAVAAFHRGGKVKSLLTGGNSFVSRAIGPALLAAGQALTICIRPGQAAPEWAKGVGPAATIAPVDLAEGGDLKGLVGDHDVIIHAAGRLENPATPASAFQRDNVATTEALIAAALATGRPKIIHFSSLSVHGMIDAEIVDENTPSREPTAYGASKQLAEQALARVGAKIASVSLRLPGIIGPFVNENWLTRCRATLRAGGPLSVANPDFLFNNVVYSEDLAGFIVALCDREWSGAHAFPIGAGTPMAVLEMVEAMRRSLGSSSRIDITETSRAPFSISSALAIQSFGYQPRPVREIIQRFALDP